MAFQPITNLFLKLNQRYPVLPHPFNENNSQNKELNFCKVQFRSAQQIFNNFHRYGNFYENIRGKKVADFACGCGGKAVYLAAKGASEVWGIDTSETFIKQAKEFAEDTNFAYKCKFTVTDAMKADLPNEYFDVVVFNDAIEHIPDPEKSLHEALRVLKPGGKIYINFESYYHYFGHHLWDALPIPWLHLFTTEAFRIKLYSEAVRDLPNGKERLEFRISEDQNGKKSISYLNKITSRRFNKTLKRLSKKGLIDINRKFFTISHKTRWKFLVKIPFLRELFLGTQYFILQKP
ncbi:class I SAM-dependent methyltransferase [Patescibacteria group bacterium]